MPPFKPIIDGPRDLKHFDKVFHYIFSKFLKEKIFLLFLY